MAPSAAEIGIVIVSWGRSSKPGRLDFGRRRHYFRHRRTAGVAAVEGSCNCSNPRGPGDLRRRKRHIGTGPARVEILLVVGDRRSRRGGVGRSSGLEGIGCRIVGVGSRLVVGSSVEGDSLVGSLGCIGYRSRRGLTLW